MIRKFLSLIILYFFVAMVLYPSYKEVVCSLQSVTYVQSTKHHENGKRTLYFFSDSINCEIQKVYSSFDHLEKVTYITNKGSTSEESKLLYDYDKQFDVRWTHFFLRGQIFEKEELAGEAGKTFYLTTCAKCHGIFSEGRTATVAPSLAGMPKWYMDKQLKKMIEGKRKFLPETDHSHSHGYIMYGLIKHMDPSTLDWLTTHYSRLSSFSILPNAEGDIAQGKMLYQEKCVSCHMANGEGNETIGSPPITIIPDWYFLRQIKSFQKGFRGVDPHDPQAMAMNMAVKELTEKQCYDIINYLNDLTIVEEDG